MRQLIAVLLVVIALLSGCARAGGGAEPETVGDYACSAWLPYWDADAALGEDEVKEAAGELAGKYGITVLASGKTDIVTDGTWFALIRNGTPQLAAVTGTGCMLGVLCGAYLPVCPRMEAAAAACAMLGCCGQIAETEKGSGTFLVNLLDALSTVTDEQLEELIELEETR